MNNKDGRERRKHKRFGVEEGTMAVLKCHTDFFGEIFDISESGLALVYLSSGEQASGPLALYIYLSSHGFNLRDLPCKSVYHLKIQKESPPGSDRPMKHGLQFGELTLNQRHKLQYFLKNHTTEKIRTL